jgi:predicted Zn-dependent protease with MMP-like domain
MRLSQRQFADLVRQAIQSLPKEFRARLENVAVEIQPAPTPRQLEELGGGPPEELFGGYLGVPLTERSVSDDCDWPETILIFQRNIERACRSRREIFQEVRTTVLHEIAHHFGMDEGDLEELGYQ